MAERYARQQEELAKERRRSQDLDTEVQRLARRGQGSEGGQRGPA